MSKWVVILHDAQDPSAAGRARLRDLFVRDLGMSKETAERVFSSFPFMVRRDLEKDKAERFLAILERLGAVAEMIEYEGSLRLPDLGLAMPEERPASEHRSPHRNEHPAERTLAEQHPASSANASRQHMMRETMRAQSELDSVSLHSLEKELEDALADSQDLTLAPEEAPKVEKLNAVMFEVEPSQTSTELPRGVGLLLDTPLEDAAISTDLGPPGHGYVDQTAFPATEQPRENVTSAPTGEFESALPVPEIRPVFVGAFGSRSPDTPGALAHLPLSPDNDEDDGIILLDRYKLGRKQLRICASVFATCLVIGVFALGSPFFGSTTPQISIKIDVESLLKQQQEILHPQVDSSGEIQWTSKVWTSETKGPGIQARLVLLEVNGRIVQGGVELATDMPPKRTPEQIVKGVPAPVWVRRVLAKGLGPNMVLVPDEQDPLRQFKLIGTGRAYVSDDKGSERVVAGVEMSGNWDEATKSWKGRFLVQKNSDATSGDLPEATRLENRDFRLVLGQEFTTKPQ